jgi:hypothetical protein
MSVKHDESADDIHQTKQNTEHQYNSLSHSVLGEIPENRTDDTYNPPCAGLP